MRMWGGIHLATAIHWDCSHTTDKHRLQTFLVGLIPLQALGKHRVHISVLKNPGADHVIFAGMYQMALMEALVVLKNRIGKRKSPENRGFVLMGTEIQLLQNKHILGIRRPEGLQSLQLLYRAAFPCTH